MTVCVATMFNWNYGTSERPDIGPAFLTASDRMLTAGEIEYEPAKFKVGFLSKHALLLIAGNYATHSEAVLNVQRQLRSGGQIDVREIAELYGQQIRQFRLRQAAQRYLAPFGLDENTFITKQREMAPSLTVDLANQMQNHRVDVEAIIVGLDNVAAYLLHIDSDGFVSCHNDSGFLSIGIGSHHSNSLLMGLPYTSNNIGYASALYWTYAAKKRAEIAPGVGTATDMYLVNREGCQPILPFFLRGLESIYQDEQEQIRLRNSAVVTRLMEKLDEAHREASAVLGQADQAASEQTSSSDQTRSDT